MGTTRVLPFKRTAPNIHTMLQRHVNQHGETLVKSHAPLGPTIVVTSSPEMGRRAGGIE